ncbi:uncharacterized protein LOC131306400 isoform X2 [Rhododendron vialii]|uniref:uncharacterized protein LOC131306400 isoform X2 n=1 Tax=Rhododendron vialii TaxID=182163 RepID=UPI00265F6C03|nr:uncharacterized protein LOC131306400 isoform X2 [Rhododendron vialii]
MKRKRGVGKRKPKLAPAVDAKESIGNVVALNTQDDLVPDDIDSTEFRSRMEFEKPQHGSKKTRQQASSKKQKVVDVNMEDNISSFPETSGGVSANVSRIARSIISKSSRGFASSIREPFSSAQQEPGGGACQKEPNLPHQERQYQDHELKAALEVIRKVMKMDAAEPFNDPVDPIAMGIPDYFDIIETPMDFGTICSNIENCAKYENSKDVLRDVQYIWDNCCKYNKKGHYILELMKRVRRNFTKLWAEAGLHMEAQETDGLSHVPTTESTMRCNIEHRNPLGSIANFARHQYQDQDQEDPSGFQPHQPPMNHWQSYQPHKRPHTYQLSSCQQQSSQARVGPNLGGAGHSHMTPFEGDKRQCSHGHRWSVDPVDDNCSHQQQKQTGQSQFQHWQHQPSSGYSQPYQPPQRSCQCHACSQQPQPFHVPADTFTASADFYASPPEDSMVRGSKHGNRCPVGPMTDYMSHQQQDLIAPNHMQPHQPPSKHQKGTYQGKLSSSQLHRGFGPPQYSQPDMEMVGAGDFCSTPPEESMIRSTKRGPRCPVGPMADHISHQQQDQRAASHMDPYQPSSNYGQEHLPHQQTSRRKLSSSQLHAGFGPPQHSQPHKEMGGAGDLCSSPPEESMIRNTKRGPRYPVGPMTDYVNHQQQDQISPNHMQPLSIYHQDHPSHLHSGFDPPQHSKPQMEMASAGYSPPPAESMIRCTKSGPIVPVVSHQQQDQITPSQMQLEQPQEKTGEGPLSSNQPEPSHSQADVDRGTADSSSTRKRKTRGRGPTRCLDVWNMDGKIPITTNEFGQPIGVEAPKLVNFLGTIARNGHMAPLNYIEWRALPDESKEKMWQQVQSKFDIEPQSRSWVLKSIGNKWKNWKALLKATRYTPHKTNEGRLADRDERVLPDQWRILVSYWNSKEAKNLSIKNKACRSFQKINHATGSKSFARVREEQRAKRPDGKEPSRAELFIVTRTRKDGRPVNEESSAIISKLRERAAQGQGTSQNVVVGDDVFHQVMGRDRHGRVRTYGLGPAPSDLGVPKSSHAEALKMVAQANAEVREMKERMVAMEQTCAQMAAQMATMMSMMSTMQKKSPDRHPPNVVDVSGKSEELQQPQGSEMTRRTTRSSKSVSRKK